MNLENKENIHFHIQQDLRRGTLEIWIGATDRKGKVHYRGEIVFTALKEGEGCEPTLTLPPNSDVPAQMITALRGLGLLDNPVDQATIKAKDDHLQDMRQIAFGEKTVIVESK